MAADIPAQALELTVLEIKKQAVAAKQSGNVAQALELLKQSKALASLDVEAAMAEMEVDETCNALPAVFYKKMALLYKQAGNLEQAKAALLKSKQVEQAEQQQVDGEADTTAATAESCGRKVTGVAVGTTAADPAPAPPAPQESTAENDGDEALLQAINQDSGDHDDADMPTEGGPVTFTLDEMMDADMMTEFASMGMDTPSMEDYAAKIVHCKKQALANKQHNKIPQATQWLRKAKQLEAVQAALQKLNGGGGGDGMDQDEDAWMKSLNAEDTSLLEELFNSTEELPECDMDDDDDSALPHGEQKLSVDELMSMDDNDVMDFIEMMGRSSLPTVEELYEKSAEHQRAAIGHKQTGLLDNAKKSLVEFKKAKHQAERLASMFQRLDAKEAGGSSAQPEMTLDDLEAMVNGGSTKQAASKPQPVKKAPPSQPANPWMTKPSAEIKKEVLRLKNAKQVKEATELLQILKQVIQKEKDEAEAAKCRQMIEKLQSEVETCKEQLRLWQLYEWFIDSTRGKEQAQAWVAYQDAMQQALKDIEWKGSSAISVSPLAKDETPSLLVLDGDKLTQSIENKQKEEVEPPELGDELEVSVLGMRDMHQNTKLAKAWKKYRKELENFDSRCPRIWIDTKVQLPLNTEDPTQPIHLAFKPTSSKRDGPEYQYEFDPDSKHSRQRLKLPDKDSKEAKTIRRRMETKSVQCSVFLSPQQEEPPEAKKSWFFGGRASKEEEPEDHSENKGALLGKVTVELHPLLSQSCTVGDYSILTNNQEIGGVIRIAVWSVKNSQDNAADSDSTGKLEMAEVYTKQILVTN